MRLSAIVRLLSARRGGQIKVVRWWRPASRPPGPRACRSRTGHHEGGVLDPERQARQPVAGARSRRAEPGVGLEDRAVGRADERLAVLGEEFVGPEVERRADVRATVDVGVVAAVEVDDESTHAAPAALETDRRRAAGGHARRRAAPAARLRRRLNMASGRPSFLWSLRVGEIVAFYGRLYGLSGQKLRRRVDELIELCELGANRRTPYSELSTGLKQRVALAKSLVNDP